MAQQQAPQSTAGLAPPAHSAAAVTPQAYQQAPSGGGGAPPAKSIDALLQAVSAIPQSATTVNPGEVTTTPGAPTSGTAGAGGKPGGKLRELFYDPLGGWDEGKSIGAIGGHGSHVHAAFSSPKVAVRAGKLAQSMGLSVREQSAFDKVDPVHTGGSFHYSDRAIDVSGDPKKMAAYTRRLKRIYGVR